MSDFLETKILQRKLRPFFDPMIVHRGNQYFDAQAVTSLKSNSFGALASVVGTQIYKTSVDWSQTASRQVLYMGCSCASFSDGAYCKHLWAVVLGLDKKGLSRQIPIPSRLSVRRGLAEPKVLADLEFSDTQEVKTDNTEKTPARRNWREAFQNKAKTNIDERPTSDQEIFITLSPDPRAEASVRLQFFVARLGSNGAFFHAKPLNYTPSSKLPIDDSPAKPLIQLISTLSLGEQIQENRYGHYFQSSDASVRSLQTQTLRPIFSSLLNSGKIFSSRDTFIEHGANPSEVALRETHFGTLQLKVVETAEEYELQGVLKNEKGEETPISSLKKFAEPDLYITENKIGFLDLGESERVWLDQLTRGPISIPREDQESFLDTVLNQNLNLQLPPSLTWSPKTEAPKASLILAPDAESFGPQEKYFLDLRFQYGTRSASFFEDGRFLTSEKEKGYYIRDLSEEKRFYSLLPLEFIGQPIRSLSRLPSVSTRNLYTVAQESLKAGIPVTIQNKTITQLTDFQITVGSGTDWFDVGAQAQLNDKWIKLPAILEAVSKGENFIPLPDGSLGFINGETADRLRKLATFAESQGDGLRFSKTQGLLLNSLLEGELNLVLDKKFEELRQRATEFTGIHPKNPVESFSGKLRKYQREGLGWLEFLESFGLGGILADDMGLGKTIQCLAFLEGRRLRRKKGVPSLLLAPRSLLQNWFLEAQKFTPKLKVLVHAGAERNAKNFKKYDLIVMTYQTMLRDIETLREMEWDCIVLDEAQAIKNAGALVSKAAKTLPAEFRLAMTGTPIENSIEDLFSISDFVNPGFLRGKKQSSSLKLSDDYRETLSKAFRPVILRRTKTEVLKDLPEKTEQTIFVELEEKQLKIYNELKRFYQSQLLKHVRDNGLKKSQIQILAALTRLRQAALHPGLIDSEQEDSSSAKFETLIEMLTEIIAEGHRVLIFSQFTSLLALLKNELDKLNIKYSFLDGKTTKRQEAVDQFRLTDIPVFLLSLKVGGVGLNLVEANYVFLLDPWWNPAVEAQAIDRAHRIGQKQAVNAYRLIARGTVEEKILDLQKTKKGLSEDILEGKSGLIRSLTTQDIEALLS